MKDTVPCSCCGGSGTKPLAPDLQVTLDWLRANGPSRVGDIWQALTYSRAVPKVVSYSAINNRLVALERFGKVEREPGQAKNQIWRAK